MGINITGCYKPTVGIHYLFGSYRCFVINYSGNCVGIYQDGFKCWRCFALGSFKNYGIFTQSGRKVWLMAAKGNTSNDTVNAEYMFNPFHSGGVENSKVLTF